MQRAWSKILHNRILIFCMYVNSLTFVCSYVHPSLAAIPIASLQRLTGFCEIFCRKHKIVRELETPERNHIILPEAKEVHVPKTLEGAPMEQDVPDQEGAPMEKDAPEETDVHHQPFSTKQTQTPPPAASDQNQCSCSSPFISFAPSSLFTQPYPGSCGWIDD